MYLPLKHTLPKGCTVLPGFLSTVCEPHPRASRSSALQLPLQERVHPVRHPGEVDEEEGGQQGVVMGTDACVPLHRCCGADSSLLLLMSNFSALHRCVGSLLIIQSID